MTDKKPPSSIAPPSAVAATGSKEPVKELNPCDVLLGRGHGSSNWMGNIQFRDLVKSRKYEYAYSRVRSKADIADEVVQHIFSKGGRFLYLDKDAKPVNNIVKEGVWYECSYKVALEKTKQALRENRDNNRNQKRGLILEDMSTLLDRCANGVGVLDGNALVPDGTPSLIAYSSSLGLGSGRPAAALSIDAASSLSVRPPTTSVLPVLPPTLVGSIAAAVSIDEHLTHFQRTPIACHLYSQLGLMPSFTSFPPQLSQPDSSLSANPSHTVAQHHYSQFCILPLIQQQSFSAEYMQEGEHSDVDMGVTSMPNDDSFAETVDYSAGGMSNIVGGESGGKLAMEQETGKRSNVATGVASVPKDDSASASGVGEDVSEFLLSVLALSGRRKFTEEQVRQEKVNMSDEERARVLCDLFGKYCSTHRDKKARKDLSNHEVAFLVKQMRNEIERIPEAMKDALMKAQVKCKAEEFSDERLESFLRCEGMDVKVRTVECVSPSQRIHVTLAIQSFTRTLITICVLAGSSTFHKLLGESSQSVWPGEVSHADGFE